MSDAILLEIMNTDMHHQKTKEKTNYKKGEGILLPSPTANIRSP
jgi:hypothetical protein